MKKNLVWLCFFGLILSVDSAWALGFKMDGSYRRIRPQLVDRFAGYDSTSSSWSSISKSSTMIRNYDLTGYLSFRLFPFVFFGIYGVYTLPESIDQEAVSATSGIIVKKRTTLSGWLVGPFIEIRTFFIFSTELTLGVGVAGGKYTLDQSVDNGGANSIRANAFSGEERIYLGISRKIFGPFNLGLQGGYARQKSVSFKTESTQGGLYSGQVVNRVVQINDAQGVADLKLNRSGVFGSLCLNLSF